MTDATHHAADFMKTAYLSFPKYQEKWLKAAKQSVGVEKTCLTWTSVSVRRAHEFFLHAKKDEVCVSQRRRFPQSAWLGKVQLFVHTSGYPGLRANYDNSRNDEATLDEHKEFLHPPTRVDTLPTMESTHGCFIICGICALVFSLTPAQWFQQKR